MKRRRRWFVGLALALLAACVGVWASNRYKAIALEKQEDELRRLGRLREEFGDVYDPIFSDLTTDEREWVCVQTTFPTKIILFPAGSADQRLYYKQMSSEHLLLVCVARGPAGPRKGWKFWLKRSSGKRKATKGTLRRFLADDGWEIPKGSNADADAAAPLLDAEQAYAAYQIDIMAESIHCGFLDPEGVLTMPEAGSADSVDLGYPRSRPLPHIGTAYPISEMERAYLFGLPKTRR